MAQLKALDLYSNRHISPIRAVREGRSAAHELAYFASAKSSQRRHRSHGLLRTPPRLRRRDRTKPAFVQLSRERLVDMGTDQSVERMRDLRIFAVAPHRPLLGQEFF